MVVNKLIKMSETKEIVYVDMDGVLAHFWNEILLHCPEIDTFPEEIDRENKVDEICNCNRNIFRNLKPIKNSIESVKILMEFYDVYFLSTPMWEVPESYMDKRLWLEEHFGELAEDRLILTKRKDLNRGHYLIDDRIKNGVDKFEGFHIHFGTDDFPNWKTVLNYFKSRLENYPAYYVETEEDWVVGNTPKKEEDTEWYFQNYVKPEFDSIKEKYNIDINLTTS